MKKNLLTFAICLLAFTTTLKAQQAPVYQYYNPTLHVYFYTMSYSELGAGSAGYGAPTVPFKLRTTGQASDPNGYNAAIYRFYSSGSHAHYYTRYRNVYPLHFQYEGILGYTLTSVETQGSVYEYTHAGSDYFYTLNQSLAPSGYTLNGYAFYAGY